ncbi:MCE family protein [Mycobacteroides abscessus]|uniref:MCE family protein n=1 Tax=Mycobacteroides abscessus TaxID=36809 RepID=UPI000241D55D|nr:MCE family protein [Mycobacteroides abscessus]EHM14969.1 virulence factor Mce family protein [Mycobacteroides abscessus subsp. bolletii BD]ORA30885.1 MCE family protein [Mycobacteroides abscessus subsp. bolletii]TPF67657.1 mammalian cell entry protein [Mycobacteroides abscessus subsp. bolletii]BBB43927.1 mammalian cell entry protein [Mycobacteroides abscessus subsp. bolletii BD]
MSGVRRTAVSFGAFVLVMVLLTAGLFAIFGQYRAGATVGYSAVFTDASSLKRGDSVRIAGVRVGTVGDISLQPDNTVVVAFDADKSVVLTAGTKVTVRYLNLTGDRYLELIDAPGSTRIQPPGSRIGTDRTEPALDLDLLLGGLKPVVQGMNPQEVNALTASLIQIFQGQGDSIESLVGRTSSFTNTLATDGQTVRDLIDNLNQAVGTISHDGDKFSATIDRVEKLVSGLAPDRDLIGNAIIALDEGTASMTDLLAKARPPLAGTIDQLNKVAPLLADGDSIAKLDLSLQKAPQNYRKLVRLGAYGSWLNQYICGLSVRVTDLQNRTAVFPWIKQDTGRCAEP